jgi:hypothetical protein
VPQLRGVVKNASGAKEGTSNMGFMPPELR